MLHPTPTQRRTKTHGNLRQTDSVASNVAAGPRCVSPENQRLEPRSRAVQPIGLFNCRMMMVPMQPTSELKKASRLSTFFVST